MTKTLLFDIETNGLLPTMTTVHCLVVRDAVTRETFRFRRRPAHPAYECHPITQPGVLTMIEAEDTIAEGVKMLEAGGTIVGHNSIHFDIPAIKIVMPFNPGGVIRDTLAMTRIIMPDTYDSDVKLWKVGRLPGELIKSHSLDAWGHRMELHKGVYAKQMQELGKDPWASWNMDLEDYCVNDVDVTEALWAAVTKEDVAAGAVELEHSVHDLCGVLQRNGFPFDQNGALRLRDNLQSAYDIVAEQAKAQFGPWFAPKKKYRVKPAFDDPEGVNAAKYEEDMACDATGETPTKRRKYYKPRPEYGEDMSTPWWGEVFVPAKEMRFRSQVPAELCAPPDPAKKGDKGGITCLRSPDAPYCQMIKKDFNPGSRWDVIDRFQQVFGWEPTEFTENGNPEVNDGVLRGLVERIPIADKIAECFFINKYLGQIANGPQAWLKTLDANTGCIHCYINTGGTVSGRCSHIGPNLGQVPAVIAVDPLTKPARASLKALTTEVAREVALRAFLDDHANLATNFKKDFIDTNSGEIFPYCFGPDGSLKDEVALRGRAGEYGWECRSLFGVPPEWRQVGVDLSGIEFRGLAELTLPFDDGELINVIISGQDIHAYNQAKTGIASRDIVKRCLYGLMYGAGDYKLGITADVTLTSFPDRATRLGREIRDQIMAGLPALKQAIDLVKREASRGYLIGLDGRRLGCRNEYSALNLRLQSDAALIAKKWLVLTEQYALEQGWDHGWFSNRNPDGLGDFAMMAFVHDEQQSAVRPELAPEFARLAIKAAADAGKFFKWTCPVDAKAKFGQTWAECH